MIKTCVVSVVTQQDTNERFAIFSDYRKTVKLQRLVSDFAKVRVQEDDCFTKHLCRNCYRTLLSLRDKLLAFQTRCATTQINLGKGGENVKRTHSSPKSSPSFTSPCGAQRQKRVSFKCKIRPGKRYSMMKKKSHVPLQLQVTKSGLLIKKQTALFLLIRVFK